MNLIIAIVGSVLYVLLFVIGLFIALRIERAHREQQQQQQQILASSDYQEITEDGSVLVAKPTTASSSTKTSATTATNDVQKHQQHRIIIPIKDQIWLALKVLCSQFGIFLLEILEHFNGNTTLTEWIWSIFWILIYSFLSSFLWFYSLWKFQVDYYSNNIKKQYCSGGGSVGAGDKRRTSSKGSSRGAFIMGLWTFNLAGTAICGTILWAISSETDEETMLYSSSSDTQEVLMKQDKWILYDGLSTIALFFTVYMTVRNWFRSGDEDEDEKLCSNNALLVDSMEIPPRDQMNSNKNQKKAQTNDVCCALESGGRGGERKSVVFREELNECFRLGGSKSGDMTASFSDEEAG